MRRLMATAATLLGLGLPLGTPSAAQASCAAEAGPEGSDVIFVGVAREERRGFTRFDVTEVWAGPDLAPSVWVLSGQAQPAWPWSLLQAVGSSTDAEFLPGDEWVVGASDAFSTSDCSVAEAGTVNELRPDHPRRPVAHGLDGADPPAGPWEIAAWLLSGIALPGIAVAGWRRRRVSRGAPPPPATAPPAPPDRP